MNWRGGGPAVRMRLLMASQPEESFTRNHVYSTVLQGKSLGPGSLGHNIQHLRCKFDLDVAPQPAPDWLA